MCSAFGGLFLVVVGVWVVGVEFCLFVFSFVVCLWVGLFGVGFGVSG